MAEGTAKVSGAETPSSDGANKPRRGRKRHRFTPTEENVLRFLAGETALRGKVCLSKQEMAKQLGCSVKSVDRCIADLRRRGYVEASMRFDENGAQISSEYRVVLKP